MLREEGVMVRISTSKEIRGKKYIFFFLGGGVLTIIRILL